MPDSAADEQEGYRIRQTEIEQIDAELPQHGKPQFWGKPTL